MSELKARHVVDVYDFYTEQPCEERSQVYLKSEADAAIDELKSAHHKERHEYIKMIAELKQKLQDQCISCPVKMQEDDVVAELKAKLEDAKATAYAESVDAGMRERKLKRALYKACANWAHHRVFVRFKTNEKAWENVERKCLKKSKEYL